MHTSEAGIRLGGPLKIGQGPGDPSLPDANTSGMETLGVSETGRGDFDERTNVQTAGGTSRKITTSAARSTMLETPSIIQCGEAIRSRMRLSLSWAGVFFQPEPTPLGSSSITLDG